MSLILSVGARVRKSPFFAASRKAGLVAASVYNHMFMPTSYGDPAAEYDRLINGVAMWDVGVERQVALKGPDALKLARLLTPRNLDGLVIGQGKYVPICNFDGVIINDPVLLQVAEDEIWLSIADSDIVLWAAAIAGAYKLDVKVFEPDVSPLAIQGPKAQNVVTDLFGDWVADLKYFGFRITELAGIPLVVARSGWSKQGGFELYLRDGRRGEDLWDIVAKAGAPYGIGPGTPNYVERLESGLISYGADTDAETNPFELGMDKFINLDQPHDFIGKAALQAIKKAGVTRRFMGLLIDGAPFTASNEHRWDVTVNGNYAGYASACAYSPRVGSNIGVGIVSVAAIEAADGVAVVTDSGPLSARVAPFPLA
jgi:glycine cleavage system aminomethyltransferase T